MESNSFKYELEHSTKYNGWTLVVESGCPNCGNDVIFNGKITENVQFVGYEEKEGKEVCGIDDGWPEIEYLSCGECGKELIEK